MGLGTVVFLWTGLLWLGRRRPRVRGPMQVPPLDQAFAGHLEMRKKLDIVQEIKKMNDG